MKKLAVFACLAIGAIAIWRLALPSATVRYRLTLEAQVDGQLRTGSGVIEVSYSKQIEVLQPELLVEFRGEAIVLDLDSRGMLFALLKAGVDPRSSPEWIALRAFGFDGLPRPVKDGVRQVQSLSGKRELPLANLPLLVRFRDINDPKTVERVDPFDLENSFGTGAKLVRASLEIVPAGIWPFSWYGITGEQITVGIKSKLGWLPEYYDRQLDGQRFEKASSALPLANSLSSGAFRAGF